jgi:lipoprotein NlpI
MLKPNFAAAYERRAYVRSTIADQSDARADYNRAIDLEPKNPDWYVSRSHFEEGQSQLDAALADLDRAVALSPKDPGLYDRRASLKYRRGDLSGMLADRERVSEVFPHDEAHLKEASRLSDTPPRQLAHRMLRIYDRAIQQDTNFVWGYYHRGVLKHLANDLDGALADFQRCSTFSDPLLNDYAALHIWLVRSQRGEATEANIQLSKHFPGENQMSWEAQIARFLLSQTSEEEFFAAIGGADTERKRSQFYYYSAMKKLLAGDKIKAAEDFRAARITETRPYAVDISAQIELSVLDARATTPY